MAAGGAGRIKVSKLFWLELHKLGIDAVSVLRHAGLPLTLCSEEKCLLTPAQFASVWSAIGSLSHDPAVGLKLGSQIQPSALPPSMMLANYARDFRDALNRHARFMQVSKFNELPFREFRNECAVEWRWTPAIEEVPLLTDGTFALLVEMGRRGMEQQFNPKRVELKQSPQRITKAGILQESSGKRRDRLSFMRSNYRVPNRDPDPRSGGT